MSSSRPSRSACCRPRRQRIDGVERGIGEASRSAARPRGLRTPAPRVRRARRQGRRREGQQSADDRPLEAARPPMPCRRSRRSRRRPSAMKRLLAIGGEILRRLACQQGLGRFQLLVGLQCAVEGRHGDGGVAAPEKAVGESLTAAITTASPIACHTGRSSDRRCRACSGRSGC